MLVSKDYGSTRSNIFSKQGIALKTAPASTSNFFPVVTEWKNNFIDLSSYDEEAEVMISFKGASRFGNNYL